MIDYETHERRVLADAVIGEMKQLAKLLEDPDLSIKDIAFRLAMKPSDLRRVLKRMGITRG